MKCLFCGGIEKIEFEFPKGIIFGVRCKNLFCMAGVIINIIENPYVKPPFPDKREIRRFMKARENISIGN